MFLTLKVCSFTVEAETEKEAYLRGCKKMAKLVASKKYKHTSSKIERVPDCENKFLFTIFTNIDLGPEYKNFCNMCKEMHCSFYINEEYNCSRCNLKAFMERVEQKARVSKNYYKNEFKK